MKSTVKLLLTLTALVTLSIAATFAALAAEQPVVKPGSGLSPGYTETYAFKIDGKSIGTQSAQLTKNDGKLQTWTFSLDLLVPLNGQTISLKQSGTYVLTEDAHPVSLDTTATTNGVKQVEKLTFGVGKVTTEFDPPIAAIAHSFPVPGSPYLSIDNLISLMSAETSAAIGSGTAAFDLPCFSANTLQPITFSLKPDGATVFVGKPCRKFAVSPIAEEVTLLDATAGIVSVTDARQKLEIVKE